MRIRCQWFLILSIFSVAMFFGQHASAEEPESVLRLRAELPLRSVTDISCLDDGVFLFGINGSMKIEDSSMDRQKTKMTSDVISFATISRAGVRVQFRNEVDPDSQLYTGLIERVDSSLCLARGQMGCWCTSSWPHVAPIRSQQEGCSYFN